MPTMTNALLLLLAIFRAYAGKARLVPFRVAVEIHAPGIGDKPVTEISTSAPRLLGNLLGTCKGCKATMCKIGGVQVYAYRGGMTSISALVGDELFVTNMISGKFMAKCACGKIVGLVEVTGKHSEHVCNVKCMSSKGPACECSCGGTNHGRSWA